VPLSTPFYMFGTCVRCPSISEVFGMLSCHLQRIRRIWNACTLFPWSQKHLGCLDAVPILSDAFGTPAHHLQRIGRVWNACTLFPWSQKHLGRLDAVPILSDAFGMPARHLQRSDAFGKLARFSQRLRRVEDA
jgi:hypothetical protein